MTGIAAAVPAVAVASVPALALTGPDAELIALGREIEAMLPRYVIVSLESCVRGWKARDLASRRSGFDKAAGTSPETPEEIAAFKAIFAAFEKEHDAAEIELGCEAWDDENARLSHEECRLTKAVRSLPATSPEGLRVKSLSVALANIVLLAHNPDALDYTEVIARDLTEAVLASLGIDVPAHLINAV